VNLILQKKRLVRFFLFPIVFLAGMPAYPASFIAAPLAEIAIRAGVLL
jgi:hypothetical protein